MAKSKKKGVKNKVESKDFKVAQNKKFEDDLVKMTIPFDLYTGLSMVTAEIRANEFVYDSFKNNGKQDIITFTRNEGKEVVLINIEKENLIVRHFDVFEDGRRKARVLYVVKPTERTFNFIK